MDCFVATAPRNDAGEKDGSVGGTLVPGFCLEQSGCSAVSVLVEPCQQRLDRIGRQQVRERDNRFWPCVTFAMGGMPHHAAKPPRDHMCGAQITLAEYHDDGSIFLNGAEIHLPHQTAENARAIELRARVVRIEGKASQRQSAASRQRLIDRRCQVAMEGRGREQTSPW